MSQKIHDNERLQEFMASKLEEQVKAVQALADEKGISMDEAGHLWVTSGRAAEFRKDINPGM